jgi:ubiquinone/menaquinone biosynthesis C-methylase UbiE
MEKNNADYYDRTVRLLKVGSGDRIMEVGCGSGLALRRVLEECPECRVTGVDFSPLMLRKAAKNNREAVAQGKVRLVSADIRSHDFGGETFTKIFGINVTYFWNPLEPVLSKLFGLLEPGGRMVLYMSSPEMLGRRSWTLDGIFHKRSVETVVGALEKTGFSRVEQTAVLKNGVPTHYVVAEKS